MIKYSEPSVSLSQLLDALPGYQNQPGINPLIRGIVLDSRQVQPGDLFVALVGGNVDAHRYIPDAVQRGASAVVGTRGSWIAGCALYSSRGRRSALKPGQALRSVVWLSCSPDVHDRRHGNGWQDNNQ